MDSLDDELQQVLALPEDQRTRELLRRTISLARAVRYLESRLRGREYLLEALLERIRLLEDQMEELSQP